MNLSSVRFRFELDQLNEIEPWGKAQRLHWFGLSEGRYWIEFGEGEDGVSLTNQSQEVNLSLRVNKGVDYYVGRFWEDLIQLTATVLEPVPETLSRFIASHPDDWLPVDSEEAWEAAVWHGRHVLDLSYIAQPPYIRAWRIVVDDVDEVVLTWRQSAAASRHIIESLCGCVRMSTASFVAAVRQMDSDFLNAMNERLSEVDSSADTYPGNKVDMGQLRQEQLSRSTWLTERLEGEQGTDWDAVVLGSGQLMR